MSELHIIMITVIFLLAGLMKGVIGFGLPTVSLGLLVMIVELPTAIALMLVPSFATNVWQSLVGGNALLIVKKIGPFLAAATASVWLGVSLLASIDLIWATIILGVLLMVYAISQIFGWALAKSDNHPVWLGPLAGFSNGVFAGLTGASIFPGLIYLHSLNFKRDQMIQAMGMLFVLSTIALALAFNANNLLDVKVGLISIWAIVPAVIGMIAGKKLRQYLSESQFKQAFFTSLLALGLIIIFKAISQPIS